MNAKIIAIIAVAVVVVAGAGTAIVIMNKDKGGDDPLAYFNEAGLKVLGNVDKDNDIDMDDYNAVKKLVDEKASAGDNKLADANNDDVLDEKDLEVIDKVIKKEKVAIWHINYHDSDSNGTMDRELVSTTIPVTSTLMTGSANNFMMFTLLGIQPGTVVKGACYSTSNDKFLYDNKTGNGFIDDSVVKNVGKKSYEILFESGKDDGASELVKAENVTCVVSDWNRTYIENEAAFESAGVDVVRVAAASFDKDVYTHSISLLGLVFSVQEQATKILNLYNSVYDEVKEATANLPADKVKKAVASSMDGAISSEDSDYTAVVVAAGAEYGLKGFDMGGSTLAYVSENLGIFDTREYQFDNIVHIRTALTYGSTEAEVAKYWSTYANAMALWEHAYDGQLLISGSIPVPCRVAYAACAIYGATIPDLSETWAKSLLTQFEAEYNGVDMSKTHNTKLVLISYEYKVTISDDVIVKDKDNNVVASGTSFPYGTQLSIEAKVVDANKTLVASGSSVKDGKFLVVDNINAKYVNNTELAILSKAASTFVEKCKGNIYMQTGEANVADIGSVALTSMGYSGANKTTTLGFTYYDTEEAAKTAYEGFKATVDTKSGYSLDTSSIVGTTSYNGIDLVFTSNVYTNKAYTGGSTIYMTAYYKNVVWEYKTYFSYYTFDADFANKTGDQAKSYFQGEATKLAQGLEEAMIAAYSTA